MEDFYKQLRDQLENRAEPTFEERDWDKLQRRLASVASSGAGAASWAWLSVPLLLLLLGTNAWWYLNSSGNQPLVSNPESATDTVFVTQLVHRTDTVFVTKTIKVPAWPSSAVSTALVSGQNLTSRSMKLPLIGILSSVHNQQSRIGLFVDTSNKEARTLSEDESNSNSINPIVTVDPLQFGKLLTYHIPKKPIQTSAPAKKKSFRDYLPTIRPYGLQLGVIGGAVVASSQNQTAQRGYQSGFQAKLGLTPHFQIWADVAYVRTHYETSVPNEEVVITEVAPPTDDFVFRKAEVPQPSWQYSVGLNYQFLVHNRVTPFLGVGYAAVQRLPYEMIYEFYNEATGVEWQFEKPIPQSELQTGLLLLQTGVGYSFSRHWKGQLMLSHRSRRSDTRQIQWTFGSGLFYHF